MRGRVLLGILLSGAMTVGIVSVSAARGARRPAGASATKSVRVSFPLPAFNNLQIEVVTVKVTAPKGKSVGSLSVRTTNDAQLRTAKAQAIYVIQAPLQRKRSATFKVYALIHRFSPYDSAGSAAAPKEPTLDARMMIANSSGVTKTHPSQVTDCAVIEQLDAQFESGRRTVSASGWLYVLESARPQTEQSTPTEDILDNVIGATAYTQGCSVEGVDGGAT